MTFDELSSRYGILIRRYRGEYQRWEPQTQDWQSVCPAVSPGYTAHIAEVRLLCDTLQKESFCMIDAGGNTCIGHSALNDYRSQRWNRREVQLWEE